MRVERLGGTTRDEAEAARSGKVFTVLIFQVRSTDGGWQGRAPTKRVGAVAQAQPRVFGTGQCKFLQHRRLPSTRGGEDALEAARVS